MIKFWDYRNMLGSLISKILLSPYLDQVLVKIGTKSCLIPQEMLPINVFQIQVVVIVNILIKVASVLFHIIFVLLQQFIMLNLFILVLMQNFEENYINIDNPI